MNWYVKRVSLHFPNPPSSKFTDNLYQGDEFSSSKVVNFPFYRAITDTKQLRFTEELITYTSSGDAPDFMDSRTNPPDLPPLFSMRLTCIIECSVLAGIEVDLTSFPLETWQTVQGPAGSYYKVDYALEMSFEAAISFKVVCKGEFESSSVRETSRGPLIWPSRHCGWRDCGGL